MRRPGRTLVAAALAAALGVGAGWLGATHPWQETAAASPADAPDGSGSWELTHLTTSPAAGYRFRRWWSDGDSVLSFAPTEDGFTVYGDVERTLEQPPWEFATGARFRPQSVAAMPGSSTGPWVAIGDTASRAASGDADPSLRSWSGEWPATAAPGWDRTPTASTLPAAPARVESANSILSADVAVAQLDGTAAAVAVYSQGQEDSSAPRTRGLTLCPDASACEWGEERAAPDPGSLTDIASAGTGFVLVTHGVASRVWFADDAGLSWREVGQAPGGARLEATVDGADGALLLWRRSARAADGEDAPDHLMVQRVTPDGSLEDVIGPLALPEHAGRLVTAAHVEGAWVVGGATRGDSPEWSDLPYDPAQALLLRAGEAGWRDVTPAVMRHQPDQTVEAVHADGDGEHLVTLASSVQRTASTWRWLPVRRESS